MEQLGEHGCTHKRETNPMKWPLLDTPDENMQVTHILGSDSYQFATTIFPKLFL